MCECPRNEEFRTHGLDAGDGTQIVTPGITADMGHQHLYLLATESGEIGIDPPGQPAVDIARHGAQRLESGNLVGQGERPDVARMPYFVDIAEKFAQLVVERPVGIGKNTDALHLAPSYSVNNVSLFHSPATSE